MVKELRLHYIFLGNKVAQLHYVAVFEVITWCDTGVSKQMVIRSCPSINNIMCYIWLTQKFWIDCFWRNFLFCRKFPRRILCF